MQSEQRARIYMHISYRRASIGYKRHWVISSLDLSCLIDIYLQKLSNRHVERLCIRSKFILELKIIDIIFFLATWKTYPCNRSSAFGGMSLHNQHVVDIQIQISAIRPSQQVHAVSPRGLNCRDAVSGWGWNNTAVLCIGSAGTCIRLQDRAPNFGILVMISIKSVCCVLCDLRCRQGFYVFL